MILIMIQGLIVSNIAFAAQSSSVPTLAAQSSFDDPLVIMRNGIRSVVSHKIQLLDDDKFQEASQFVFSGSLAKASVCNRIPREEDDGLRKELYQVMTGLLVDSYNSAVDMVEESGGIPLDMNITMEAYYDENDVIVNVIDNVKRIDSENGRPVKKVRERLRYIRAEKDSAEQIENTLKKFNGKIIWHSLGEGTWAEIRIPKKNMPPGFSIAEKEYIFFEDEEYKTQWDEKKAVNESFRNIWAFESLNHIVAQALDLQISKYTLEDILVSYIGKDLLGGFDLKSIEEVRREKKITEFSLLSNMQDGTKTKLTYSFNKTDSAKAIIPVLGDFVGVNLLNSFGASRGLGA